MIKISTPFAEPTLSLFGGSGRNHDTEVHYLVENYRFTPHIIEAANQCIGSNTDRMKTEHPIRIDRHRTMLPAGGEFGRNDPVTGGKVQIIRVSGSPAQAQAVVAEIQRLRGLGADDWSQIAVLSSNHRELAQVRTLAETSSIPIRWVAHRDKMPPLHQIREIRQFLRAFDGMHNALKRASDFRTLATAMFGNGNPDPWAQFLFRLLDGWADESGNAELPVFEALEFLYEACAESRQEFSYGEGVTLSTVHSAKGTEFDHVLLVGNWTMPENQTKLEENRRTFYVGMTRARKSLAIFDRQDIRPSLITTLRSPVTIFHDFDQTLTTEANDLLNYDTLGLEDIHLGFPGKFPKEASIHGALTRLKPGDKLVMRSSEHNGIALF